MIIFLGVLVFVGLICAKNFETRYNQWKDSQKGKLYWERIRKEREFSNTLDPLQKKEDFPLPKDMDVAMECQQIYQHISGNKGKGLGFTDDEMIAFLHRSLEIDPKDSKGPFLLMSFYWEKKQYDEVIKYATKGIECFPDDDDEDNKMQRTPFYHHRALALANPGDWDSMTIKNLSLAIEDMEIAAEWDRRHLHEYGSAFILKRMKEELEALKLIGDGTCSSGKSAGKSDSE